MPEQNTATSATRKLTGLEHRRQRRHNYADRPLWGGKRVGKGWDSWIGERIMSLHHLVAEDRLHLIPIMS